MVWVGVGVVVTPIGVSVNLESVLCEVGVEEGVEVSVESAGLKAAGGGCTHQMEKNRPARMSAKAGERADRFRAIHVPLWTHEFVSHCLRTSVAFPGRRVNSGWHGFPIKD